MSTEIYYFSGTGNSLHVARELQKRLPESDLVPIARLLHEDTLNTTADTVGFVFPNFCLTLPIPLHNFLERVDVASARYLFALCTRGGTPSDAFDYINELLKRQGRRLDAQINITMPWNHPLGKENLPALATEERVAFLEAGMQRKLDTFSQSILAQKAYLMEDTDVDYVLPQWVKAMSSWISKSLNYELHRYMYQDMVHFYSDEQCVGCGICEKVCPSHKIQIVNQKPVWQEATKCYACMACINYCPQHAIQIRSRFPVQSSTSMTGRFHHPSVTYKDIAQQR
ncbi:MAG: EFR1 family ferrodoxin [Anaerolineae bacterium]|nr:EFR1 family ferrodoxin [Anaerolineae bacterium]